MSTEGQGVAPTQARPRQAEPQNNNYCAPLQELKGRFLQAILEAKLSIVLGASGCRDE